MDSLEKEFSVEIDLFKQFCKKYEQNYRQNKDFIGIVNHLTILNQNLKDNETKLNEKISYYIKNNKQTEITANELLKIKKENENLLSEKNILEHSITNLQEYIKQLENNQKNIIENLKQEFNNREKYLQEKLESLQANFALESYELKSSYDEKLKKAETVENHLRNEISTLKNQMTSATSVLNKKISMLQEKNQQVEKDKSLNIPEQATKPQNYFYKSIPGSINSFKQYENFTKSSNLLNKTEKNTTKNFQFRKSKNAPSILLSPNYDPFKMHQQICSNTNFSPSSSHFQTEISSEENNDNENCSQLESETQNVENYENPSVLESNKKKNVESKNPKRKKLFDPNNFDYLE